MPPKNTPNTPAASATEATKTETKNDKFRRIATARVGKARDAIELLGGLASKAYQYDANEVKALMMAIEQSAIKVAKKLNAFIETSAPSKAAADFDPFAVLNQPAPQPVETQEVEVEKVEG